MESLILAGCSGLIVGVLGFLFSHFYEGKRNTERINNLKEELEKQTNSAEAKAIKNREMIDYKVEKSEFYQLRDAFNKHNDESVEIQKQLAVLTNNQKHMSDDISEIKHLVKNGKTPPN